MNSGYNNFLRQNIFLGHPAYILYNKTPTPHHTILDFKCNDILHYTTHNDATLNYTTHILLYFTIDIILR